MHVYCNIHLIVNYNNILTISNKKITNDQSRLKIRLNVCHEYLAIKEAVVFSSCVASTGLRIKIEYVQVLFR